MDIGRTGVWTRMDGFSIRAAVEFWGDEAALVARVVEHRAVGAMHVCIQPLDVDNPARPSR
jgi:hypothetical protein